MVFASSSVVFPIKDKRITTLLSPELTNPMNEIFVSDRAACQVSSYSLFYESDPLTELLGHVTDS